MEFTYALLGAVMVGWMILLAFIIHGPLRSGERWAWIAVLASVGVWFVLDTTMSLASGYPENAALNAVFGVGFGVGTGQIRLTRTEAIELATALIDAAAVPGRLAPVSG